MLTIGDFARFAGVSVRMLRHYDALGLLTPTAVDPSSGYRRYDESLLPRAHRLVALRRLGFGLDRVAALLDAEPAEVRRLLEDRRAELAAQIDEDRARLAEVERRLRLMEGDTMQMTFDEKPLPALAVTQLTAEVAEQPGIGPVIGPLFERLAAAVAAAGVDPEPSLAWYDLDRDGIRLAACGPAGLTGEGFEQAELDAVPRAVVGRWEGPLTAIADAWQALGAHLAGEGLHAAGVCREVYHATGADPADPGWVVELQQPVA